MKKNAKEVVFTRDNNGEYIYNDLGTHIKAKYKPDTLFDKPWMSYVIMVICGIVDCVVFISLFSILSYDSPILLAMQVLGCFFAFDIVPIYGGVQLKRMRQGLSKDKFLFYLAAGVFTLAFVMNAVLRILSISIVTPDASGTSYFGTVSSADTGTDSSAVALTVFAIIIPLLTSLGSFLVSYMTYRPWRIKRYMAEKMLSKKKDEIRRLDAYLSEFEADKDFAQKLLKHDEGKFIEMQKYHRALALSYAAYVRQRLKEHLADPVATNILSEEFGKELLERIEKELIAMDSPFHSDIKSTERLEETIGVTHHHVA